MITEGIIFVILGVITNFINIILAPIDLLISTLAPNITTALTTVETFFENIAPTFSYAISWTLLAPNIIALVLGYWVFSLTVRPTVYLVKLTIKWIKTIKIW